MPRKGKFGYRLKGDMFKQLAQERRDLIEAAPTTLEVRDDRTFVVRHLASRSSPPALQP